MRETHYLSDPRTSGHSPPAEAPQPCAACGVLVETFRDWFTAECRDDQGHDVSDWLALPFEEVSE